MNTTHKQLVYNLQTKHKQLTSIPRKFKDQSDQIILYQQTSNVINNLQMTMNNPQTFHEQQLNKP